MEATFDRVRDKLGAEDDVSVAGAVQGAIGVGKASVTAGGY